MVQLDGAWIADGASAVGRVCNAFTAVMAIAVGGDLLRRVLSIIILPSAGSIGSGRRMR